jgi:glycosyltransferase involved in cell wall biosynthesis|tara:strand:- start:7700 stop:8398 length:699 start_codon:yes stop_codon:yes gene_type:complete
MSNRVDFVFNAFNEIETIENDISEIFTVVKELQTESKIIIAEDGSTDGTSEKLLQLKSKFNLTLSQTKERRGYSKALIDGISLSKADIIFFSDMGSKFNWSDIKKIVQFGERDVLVIGVRVNRTDPLYRQVLTKMYSVFIKSFYGYSFRDPDSGFRVYDRNTLNKIIEHGLINNHLLNSEIGIRCLAMGNRLIEVDINYKNRNDSSRGLPVKIIPKVILSTIQNAYKIRKDL